MKKTFSKVIAGSDEDFASIEPLYNLPTSTEEELSRVVDQIHQRVQMWIGRLNQALQGASADRIALFIHNPLSPTPLAEQTDVAESTLNVSASDPNFSPLTNVAHSGISGMAAGDPEIDALNSLSDSRKMRLPWVLNRRAVTGVFNLHKEIVLFLETLLSDVAMVKGRLKITLPVHWNLDRIVHEAVEFVQDQTGKPARPYVAYTAINESVRVDHLAKCLSNLWEAELSPKPAVAR